MKVMLYHNLEGRLEPLNPETKKAKKWTSFAEHMNYMLGQCKVSQAI